jgi:hypothetical protein
MAKAGKTKADPFIITRGRDSGVQCGFLVGVDKERDEVLLREARQIWRFGGAQTLQEVAAKGASMTEYTRISEAAPGVATLRFSDVCARYECSPEAAENLRKPRWM